MGQHITNKRDKKPVLGPPRSNPLPNDNNSNHTKTPIPPGRFPRLHRIQHPMLVIPLHIGQNRRRLRNRPLSNPSKARLPGFQRRHRRRNDPWVSLILQLELNQNPHGHYNATLHAHILDLAHLRLYRVLPNRRCHLLTLHRDRNKKSNEHTLTKPLP